MEKEALISELKTRVGETPLTPRSFDEYANVILPTVPKEGEIPQSFWDLHVSVLNTMGGQLRHDNKLTVEKAVADAKAEWEKSHQNPPANNPPANNPPSNNPPQGFEETMKKLFEEQRKADDANYAELRKSYEESSTVIKQLQDKLAEKDRLAMEAGKKSAVVEAVKKLGEVNEAVLDLTLGQLQITDEVTVEQLVETAKAIYGKEYKRFFGDGATPFKGTSAEENNKSNVDAYIKKLQEKQEAEAKRLEEQKKLLR